VISVIVPTTGQRPTLAAALASIECAPEDEILLVGPTPGPDPRARHLPCASAHDWGATERTQGMAAARGTHLAFLDDDDVFVPGHRTLMARAIARYPDRPVLFRLTYPNGRWLWDTPALTCGNVSTQMILIPNDPARLGSWQSGRRECDFDFLASMRWPVSSIVWATDVICHRSEETYER